MDELQDRLVRIGLASVAEFGFALAGGYALQAHGLADRMSEDVDLFTDRSEPAEFHRALQTVVDAYRREGLEVSVVQATETFARLRASDPRTGQLGSVDIAGDFRGSEPVQLSIGPVLAESDAVASKVAKNTPKRMSTTSAAEINVRTSATSGARTSSLRSSSRQAGRSASAAGLWRAPPLHF